MWNCFNDISVNANLISVGFKSKWQRINTKTATTTTTTTIIIIIDNNKNRK